LQKTPFNILVAHKKQFACKKQFSSIRQKLSNFAHKKQLVCKKQFSLTCQELSNLAHKKQLACKKQFNLTRQESSSFAHKKQLVCKKQSSSIRQKLLNLAHKKLSSYLNLKSRLAFSNLKREASSRILQAIRKRYFSKIKYRSPLFFRIFIERRVKQVERPSIQLNVVELKARGFDCVVRAKNVEIFSITLREINLFLNFVETSSRFGLDLAQFSNSLNSSRFSLFYKDIKINIYDRDRRLALHQMKKKIHLATFIT